MKLLPTRAARIAAALTVALAAGATAAVTAAGTGAAAAAAAPACTASQVRPWIGLPGDGAAGSVAYELQLSNLSKSSCSLFGFPGVSAVNSKGQLGSPAARDHTYAAKTVTLGPGATAHFLLKITNVMDLQGCHPVTATGLRIFAPNTSKSSFVPFTFKACSTKGIRYMFTRVVRPKAGIPGYSQ